jgi:hypothetical protein
MSNTYSASYADRQTWQQAGSAFLVGFEFSASLFSFILAPPGALRH